MIPFSSFLENRCLSKECSKFSRFSRKFIPSKLYPSSSLSLLCWWILLIALPLYAGKLCPLLLGKFSASFFLSMSSIARKIRQHENDYTRPIYRFSKQLTCDAPLRALFVNVFA